jgi:L-lactate dehydrogenase complex protein LldG
VFKPRLFNQIDAGFTVAQAALADTGTLILRPHPGAPRSLSLVPPLHVALVWSDTLYPSLPVALQAERWTEGLPGNVVLISSPSKTSDIQQTLAFGAHGPRALWVFIVEREAA